MVSPTKPQHSNGKENASLVERHTVIVFNLIISEGNANIPSKSIKKSPHSIEQVNKTLYLKA